jgi:4-amino-4-deoxy-L-arabinose transferase-like glycosyltransferase
MLWSLVVEATNKRPLLPVWNADDKRDRRRRWIAIGCALVGTQVPALVISLTNGFFDPWFFLMVAAPAVGIALSALAMHVLRSAINRISGRRWNRT